MNASPSTASPAPEAVAQTKPKALARSDKHIWGIFIVLCIISVIELYSASSREVAASSIGVIGPIVRHLFMLGMGVAITWILSRRHYSDFAIFTVVFSALSAVAMLYVMFYGNYVNGARRSFSLLGIGVYPAEMVKISAVLLVALVMTLNQDPHGVGITKKGMIWSGVVIMFFSALLIEQGLTNTLLLIAITYSMMLIGGVRWLHLISLTAFYAMCGVFFVGYLYFTEVNNDIPADASQAVELADDGSVGRKPSRIETWIARMSRHSSDSIPKWEIEPVGKNRQEILSYMAQANGGIHGVARQLTGIGTPSVGVLRLHICDRGRGIRAYRWSGGAYTVSVAACTCSRYSLAVQHHLSGTYSYGHGCDDSFPGVVPYGYSHRGFPCVGAASASDIQGWHIHNSDVYSIRHNALGEPHGIAPR